MEGITFWHILLTPEGHAALAAVTSLDIYGCCVKVAHLCWQLVHRPLPLHTQLDEQAIHLLYTWFSKMRHVQVAFVCNLMDTNAM